MSSEVNETQTVIGRLQGEIKQLEENAIKHEQAARECRTLREQKKAELAATRAVMHDAAVARSVAGSMEAAMAARQAAEASKTEAAVLVDQLKTKIAELDTEKAAMAARSAKFDAMMASLNPPTDTPTESGNS